MNKGPAITILYTANSIYEIDQEGKQVRRRSGLNKPLPNQVRNSADGQWAPFVEAGMLGPSACIVWGWEDTGDGPVLRRTQTSRVAQIDGPPLPALGEHAFKGRS